MPTCSFTPSFIHPPGVPGAASAFVNTVLDGANAGLMLHDRTNAQTEDSGWYLSVINQATLEFRSVRTGNTVDGITMYSLSGTNQFAPRFDGGWDLGTSGNRWKSLNSYGKVNLKNIPTSSSGLTTGDVWSNSGVLTIVP